MTIFLLNTKLKISHHKNIINIIQTCYSCLFNKLSQQLRLYLTSKKSIREDVLMFHILFLSILHQDVFDIQIPITLY